MQQVGEGPSVLELRDALAAMPEESLRRLLSVGTRVFFEQGADLVRQGDPSDAMYLLLLGRVQVVRRHRDLPEPLLLAVLGAGEVVGEMGLLDGMPRSATVTAIEQVVIARRITAREFGEVIVRSPEIYGGLVRIMSARLRSTDELVAALAAERAREST